MSKCALRLKGAFSLGVLSLTACSPHPSGSQTASNIAAEATASEILPPSLPTGVLDINSLVAFGRAKMAYVRPDQYTKGFDDSALSGRQFKVSIPIKAEGSILISSYDADSERLSISISAKAIENYISGFYNYIPISEETSYGTPVTMSNAFGVTRKVTPVTVTSLGLGTLGDKLGIFPPEEGLTRPLEKTLPMQPDRARSIADDLVMEIEGSISKDTNGRTIVCVEHKEQPELDKTFPEDAQACIIHARLNRMAVVSASGGMLAEWRDR